MRDELLAGYPALAAPGALNALTLRESMERLRAKRRRERRESQRFAYLITEIKNQDQRRQKPLKAEDLFPHAFGHSTDAQGRRSLRSRGITKERYEANVRREKEWSRTMKLHRERERKKNAA